MDYDWTVTGLVPGRAFAVTGVDVRPGEVEISYRLSPGIEAAEAPDRLRLLPRIALDPERGPGTYVEGGFEPGTDRTDGVLVLHDDAIVPGAPVRVVLRPAAGGEPSVVLACSA